MGKLVINLQEKQFGRLRVLRRSGSRHGGAVWQCGCLCGNLTKVTSDCLTRRNGTTSCGKCNDIKKYPKEYTAWKNMNARCTNPNDTGYKHYGGRGITICPEWEADFFNFLLDVGLSSENLSLDRIDNNLGYYKDNCKWSTCSEQNSNRRKYTFKSKTPNTGMRCALV